MANSIKKGFENFSLSQDEIKRLVDQGLIFYIITLLVSYSRSLELGKVERKYAIKIRRKLINEILADSEIIHAYNTFADVVNLLRIGN